MAFIEVDNVSFAYGKRKNILEELSLNINQYDCTGIIGENGSGKTTLCKLIMGILKPNRGRVLIDDNDIKDLRLSDIGSIIGYLFQNPERQLFTMKVKDELRFPFVLRENIDENIECEITKILKNFDLEDKKDDFVFKLSYGEKQRLALAAILINKPKFIILDEPTTGLDNTRKNALSGYLDMVKREGTGLIIISHDIEFITHHCDRIITLSGGEIIGDIYREQGRCKS